MTTNISPTLAAIIKYQIPNRYWEEFRAMVNKGEASEEFCKFLDTNESCQAAMEEAMEARHRPLHELIRMARPFY